MIAMPGPRIGTPEQSNDADVKLTADGKDYDVFVPGIEGMIHKHGKVRILLEMHDFHGWDTSALWEDIKFDWKHYSDIEKIAMVGNSKWSRAWLSSAALSPRQRSGIFRNRSVKRRSVG
jgi:hypothetical protein